MSVQEGPLRVGHRVGRGEGRGCQAEAHLGQGTELGRWVAFFRH